MFDNVDKDGSGLIDEMEMVRLLSRLGKSLQREELDEEFTKLDKTRL